MTRFRLLLAAVVLISATVLPAERVEDLAKPTDYVSDFAHVLSPDTIARLDHLCGELDHSAANAQVAVVTVHDLDGDDAADWASRLEDKWQMGKKGTDRGVLILLAVDVHKRRIDVGYGLEGILPDAKVGDIGREMVPYLRQNDYDDAVTTAVTQIGRVIAADAHVTLQDQDQGQDQAVQPIPHGRRVVRHGFPLGGIIFLLIILFFFGGFRLLAFLLGWNLFTGGYGRGPFGGGFGGGGFGGGGGNGGGGGDGFGGFGGGGFGGGGAGGDW